MTEDGRPGQWFTLTIVTEDGRPGQWLTIMTEDGRPVHERPFAKVHKHVEHTCICIDFNSCSRASGHPCVHALGGVVGGGGV